MNLNDFLSQPMVTPRTVLTTMLWTVVFVCVLVVCVGVVKECGKAVRRRNERAERRRLSFEREFELGCRDEQRQRPTGMVAALGTDQVPVLPRPAAARSRRLVLDQPRGRQGVRPVELQCVRPQDGAA